MTRVTRKKHFDIEEENSNHRQKRTIQRSCGKEPTMHMGKTDKGGDVRSVPCQMQFFVQVGGKQLFAQVVV